MASHVLNDVYPLVLHGYLRARTAPYILNILIFRCVILGILVWDTTCALYKIFGRRPRQLLDSSLKTKGHVVAWLITRAFSLAWMAMSVQFPIREYDNCTMTVRAIAGLELVVVMLSSLLGGICLFHAELAGKTASVILIISILAELGTSLARVMLLESYSFVQDAGMCSWKEHQVAFLIFIWAQGDFWISSTISLLLDLYRNRQRGFDGQRNVKAKKAAECLKFTIPVSLSALTLIWTGMAWGDANTFGAIQPVNLVTVAATIASCKFVEATIMEGLEEQDWITDKE